MNGDVWWLLESWLLVFPFHSFPTHTTCSTKGLYMLGHHHRSPSWRPTHCQAQRPPRPYHLPHHVLHEHVPGRACMRAVLSNLLRSVPCMNIDFDVFNVTVTENQAGYQVRFERFVNQLLELPNLSDSMVTFCLGYSLLGGEDCKADSADAHRWIGQTDTLWRIGHCFVCTGAWSFCVYFMLIEKHQVHQCFFWIRVSSSVLRRVVLHWKISSYMIASLWMMRSLFPRHCRFWPVMKQCHLDYKASISTP